MRRAIQILLVSTIGTLLVLCVSGGLWGLLRTVGDRTAAQSVGGVALVAVACWGISFVALVIVLAVAHLRADE